MTRIVVATFNIQDTEPANAILKVKTSGGSTHSDSSSSSKRRTVRAIAVEVMVVVEVAERRSPTPVNIK